MVTPKIPPSATKVIYQPSGEPNSQCYWTWKTKNKWYWHTLGQDGVESSQVAAADAARRYIRDGPAASRVGPSVVD